MGFYITSKGCPHRGHQEKGNEDRYLTQDQVKDILRAVEDSKKANPSWQRDHAAIYLGFYLGLRVGEVRLLTRSAFRIVDRERVFIPTLKQTEKIEVRCKCGLEVRVSRKRAGKGFFCQRCGETTDIPKKARRLAGNPPERPTLSPPVIEQHVRAYVRDYIATLPEGQECLFVSRWGKTLSTSFLHNVFNTYAKRAGLPPVYSFHALRHGRGVMVWEASKDLVLVKDMLRHSNPQTAHVYSHISPTRLGEYRGILEKTKTEGK